MPGPSQSDPVTARVMATGPARYFSQVSPADIVSAKAKLLETANHLEAFLSGEGRGSDLDGILDDLTVSGLRTSASWIEDAAQLRGSDFIELAEIAMYINVPPIRESEAAIQSEMEEKIRAFVEQRKL